MSDLEKKIYKHFVIYRNKKLNNYNNFIDNLVLKKEFCNTSYEEIKKIIESNYEMYSYFN